MPKFEKTANAVSKLSPEQYRVRKNAGPEDHATQEQS
jgi:hypothetical protein